MSNGGGPGGSLTPEQIAAINASVNATKANSSGSEQATVDGGDDFSFPGQVNPGFGGMDNAPVEQTGDGSDQAGLAVRNQAGRASRSLYS